MKSFIHSIGRQGVSFLKRRKFTILSVGIVVLLMFVFGALVKAFFIIGLVLAASFSTYYRRYFKFGVGFELVTFSTVLATVAYGPWVGAVVGFVSSAAAEVLPQIIDPSSFFWIFSLPVSAFVVAFLHTFNVPLLFLGLACLAVQNVISEPFRIFSGDSYLKTMSIIHIVFGSVWNFLFFTFIAPGVLQLMI